MATKPCSFDKSSTQFLFDFSVYKYCVLILGVLLISYNCEALSDNQWLDLPNHRAGRINIRNVDLDPSKRKINDVLTPDSKVTEYLTDTRQENANPSDIGGIIIQQASKDLSTRLRWLTNYEIGITDMQAIYDSLPYEESLKREHERLEEIVERLRVRFRKYLQVLKTNKITVENLYKFHVKQPITLGYSCCSMECKDLKTHELYGCQIATHTSCDLIPPSIPRGVFNPGRNLTEVWRSNAQYFPSLKWQYFISMEGLHNEYPANTFSNLCDHSFPGPKDCHNIHDVRHRDVFLRTIQPQRKYVVIMMDHGNSLSPTQLLTAKAITKHLIASFSDNDRIGVIGLSNKPLYPRSDPCLPHTMVPATFETRFYFSKFIDNLEKLDSITNHTLGFLRAFEMIEDLMESNAISDNAMILYVSRGLLSSLTEAREVMDVVAIHNAKTGHKVIINTYAVIDDGKTIMYEKSFLKDVAYQNFARYDVQYRLKSPPVIRGIMMAINSTQDLSSSVGRFYLPLNRTAEDDPVFSLPYIDEADRALTMSLSQPCVHTLPDKPDLHHLIGLVGIDLHMEDVVQDVTYYSHADNSYAFIVTSQGYTIMHPSFQRPIRTRVQPMHTDIRHFEQHSGFLEIRSAILSLDHGDRSLVLRSINQSSEDGDEVVVEHSARYIWKKVESVPFIVVIKSYYERQEQKQLKSILMLSQPELLYHRLDLFPNDKMCYHLKQLSTPDMSTVFLSANSFINPFEHLSEEETKRSVQSYIAYLKDDTRLITNPGLKSQVRNDVAATGRITEEWLKRHKASNLNDYIIRRYVGTPIGVLRTFPGTLLDKMFDPTKREWYTRALEHPGHVTLSAPYLDVGGAGYIVTISHTIFEGKPAALHSPSDKVVAVMGIDMTLGYFHKLLIAHIKPCDTKGVRCFLMDDKGYLIAHPGHIDPTGKGPAEQRHITHMEPLVANDILNHRGFVQKKLCNRYNDRTVQRYFNFNTSFVGTLTNLVHGEQCARYQITPIPGTNAFLGLVNNTCDTATAFCPCSMYDRLCLNCKRMEQTECECPCECPLEMDFCSGQLLDIDDKNPSCPHDPEREKLAVPETVLKVEVEQCIPTSCEKRTTKLDCLGVMDCQWCQVQKDGKTPLETPYCGSQRVCFGGVLGAHSPYGDEISVEPEGLEQTGVKSTPVGPVAGGIMGCFLLLALGVYCYRHHVHRHNHHYMSTLPDNTNRISHYYNDEDQEGAEDVSAGECHTNFVLASFENPASVSPYRVNTSYRRPAGGDSDHGYSTMTPHEDSEHASMPCLDPLSIGKDRFRPAGHTLSLCKPPVLPPPPQSYSRRSRSPTPPQTRLPTSTYSVIPEQTVLPFNKRPFSMLDKSQTVIPEQGPHSILANVQVHMVDSH
ncbi:VWFA and cache domain-containing protein 1 isoform X1 [Biomphalaria pfeifferi]|uniref:VWFA and cache domain-containing protein 1 isoform X1 n=1 Tax=Biomphalaria pfeifferi TaxID=112525 RepID=A0AAD8F182_BIOPF|nr:VWFA and cache domain-containing protein 1 isoform X1 [Biomphalaria pfeifferi]